MIFLNNVTFTWWPPPHQPFLLPQMWRQFIQDHHSFILLQAYEVPQHLQASEIYFPTTPYAKISKPRKTAQVLEYY